jgi:uncharacterized protein (TIGR02246 family)
MRSSPVGIVLLLGLIGGVVGTAPTLAAEAGVAEVDARWIAAMKANDVNAIVACYATDAVMWLPDAPEARGEKAIREAYQGWLSASTVTEVTLTNAVYQTAGDLSCGWGDFAVTLQPKSGGAPTVLKGRFTGIAQRRGGRWVYIADHASSGPGPAKP